MNRLEKIRIWFFKIIDSIFKVSETDKITALIEKKEEKYEELKKAYYQAEGRKKTLQNKIEGMKLTLKDIDKASVKYRKSNDDVNLRKLFSAKKNVEKELSMNEKTLEMNTKIATELYDRKTEMETYINDLKHKLEQLKIKEDYTKQANEFLSVMDETNDRDSFKISEDIVDTDFNATEFMIEDHKNNVSVETLISKIDEDEEFERFKRGI